MTSLTRSETEKLVRSVATPVPLSRLEFLKMAFRLRDRVPRLSKCTPSDVFALADALEDEARQLATLGDDD